MNIVLKIDQTRFPSKDMHGAVLSLLEFFEIVYKLRMYREFSISRDVSDEQMFFVPSLLLSYNGEAHPSTQFWHQIEARYMITLHLLCY